MTHPRQEDDIQTISTSVCVVGAGPAGIICSLHLQKLGIDHVLVDAKIFPRDKVCGEAFDGRVSRLLDELSPNFMKEMEELGIIEKSWTYSLHFNKVKIPIHFDTSAKPRIQAIRKEFDGYLFEQAAKGSHCKTLQGYTMQSYTELDSGVTIQCDKGSIKTQLLVMATGAQGRKPENKNRTSLFLRQYYADMPLNNRQTEIHYVTSPQRAVICFSPVNRGLCNVQLGVSSTLIKQDELSLNELFETIKQDPKFKERFDKATPLEKPKGTFMAVQNHLPDYTSDRVIPIGARLITVNTASGMGVGNAMTMGKLTALHIQGCLENKSFTREAHQALHRQIHKSLKNILLLNRLLNFLQAHNRLMEPFTAFLLRLPLVNKILHDPQLVHKLGNPLRLTQFLFVRTPKN